MSDHNDEPELQALERQLDDAFETTRPRAGFDDELWTRIQASEPAPRRLREALAALARGIRPAVPASAVALVLIVAVGAGIIALNGLGRGGGATSTGATSANQEAAPYAGRSTAGAFGRLPSPVFGTVAPKGGGATAAQPTAAQFAGPVRYTWTGSLVLNLTTVPVFRYREPSTKDADQFASGLGAVVKDRPSGYLGGYAAVDYTMTVRGTVQSPPASPAYFIFSAPNMPASDAAGGPQAVADVFLAQHNLTPPWQYAVEVDSSGDPAKVIYERQLEVPGYGPAFLLDANGSRYGIEVDVSANRPVKATGMLPLGMDVANYNLATVDDGISALNASPSQSASPAPVAQLDHGELVYVLVPAGDHSFYEPAFLLTGSVQTGGKSYTEQVLIPAVDPTQRAR